jgi:general secretion pathway protein D
MRKCLKILSLAVCVAALCAGSDEAARVFEAGEKAARAGDSFKAYLLYSQAARMDPSNALYAGRRAALASAAPLTRSAQLGVDPAQETIEAELKAQGIVDTPEAQAAPPPRLLLAPGKRSFDIRGDAQTVFPKVAEAYGIQVVFDRDYQSPAASLRFQITDATAEDALRALEAATDSFLVPLAGKLAMVARDTAQKRTELTPVMSVAVPIPERLSAQEAQEIATAVQQTIEIRRISMDAAKRVVYFRDAVTKVLAARRMFQDLSRARAQVEVEVEFVSVGKTSSLSYGLSLPSASPIVVFGNFLNNVPSAAAMAGNFFALGGGSTLLGMGIADAAAFATLSRSSTDTLLDSRIVSLDGQAATLHVGDSYPVITGNFTGLTGAVAQTGTLSSSIRFEDLGLVLKVTPTVHENLEVTLDVDAAFKTLGSGSVNGIPVIASRQYQGKVRLKEGEWAVIAGLVSTSDAETPTGIAGLSDVPLLGRLFTHQTRQKDDNETLVVLKPRLVALPPWESVTSPLWIGTETRPATAF